MIVVWAFYLALAIVIVLAVALISGGVVWFMKRGNPRIRAARQRRKQAQKRADEQARHTIEVLAEADALADEVADLREGLTGERERGRLRALRATLRPGTTPDAGDPAH